MRTHELIKILGMFEHHGDVKIRNHHLEDTEIVQVKIQVDKKTKEPILILSEREL